MASAGEVESGSPADKGVQDSDVITVELPAPDGWKKKFTPKKAGAARRPEIIFIAPTGEEIKNKRQLDQYLRSNPGGPPSSEFDWGTGDTPRRSARISEKAKATESPETERPKKRERKSSSKKGSKENKGGSEKEDEPSTEAPEPEDGGEKVNEAAGVSEKEDEPSTQAPEPEDGGEKVNEAAGGSEKEDEPSTQAPEPEDGGEKVNEAAATEAAVLEDNSKTQQEKVAVDDTEAMDDKNPADTEMRDSEKLVKDAEEEINDIKNNDATISDPAAKIDVDVQENATTVEAPQQTTETEKTQKEHPARAADAKENKSADQQAKDLAEGGDDKNDPHVEPTPPSNNSDDAQVHPPEHS